MIDWITARLPVEHLPRDIWDGLLLLSDRIMRFCPRTGVVAWESSAWDSIRSDSHQIAFRCTADSVWVQGSPARVTGTGCAVFGSGPSAEMDLVGCLKSMIAFVSKQVSLDLPTNPVLWLVSRVDVTQNLKLNSLADVRVALAELRGCEGGRYRVSQTAGDTVYWSNKSRFRSGKAYAKGPHIKYMLNRKDYSGFQYSQKQQILADRILRLELKLGAQWFRERCKPWYTFTRSDLIDEWNSYFNRMIGSAEIMKTEDIKPRIDCVAPTDGQAKAAYLCYLSIQQNGWEHARTLFTKPTWYRNLKILRLAGLGDADISAGNVISLRRKVIASQVIESWEQFYKVA